jgi:hypothetical protein
MRWTKPQVNEALATLYLRLNGYFTTGLILHSPDWGENRTELDCIAIRHPNHSQPERGIESSEFLAVQEGEMDVVVCEVKSLPEELAFNEALRTDLEAISALLRWVGVFDETQVGSVAKRLQPLLHDGVSLEAARSGVLEERCRVRPLLCCPACPDAQSKDRWCLTGSEIFRFVDECFNAAVKRESCSTRYNFQQWGYALRPLVTYFKNVPIGGSPNLADLYKHLGVA